MGSTAVKRGVVRGFTLLEMSLVLVVFALLLGGLLQPLLSSREQLLQRRAQLQLDAVHRALLGFAASRGHLPCPATEASAGAGATLGEACAVAAGFVPGAELALAGELDAAGALLDPWGGRLRYALSTVDSDGDGQPDFARAGGMQRAGLARLRGDLRISHWAGAGCSDLQLRASRVVAVVHSGGAVRHDGDAERLNRAAAGHYATGAFSRAADCGYDDLLRWVSDSELFTQMLRARRLP